MSRGARNAPGLLLAVLLIAGCSTTTSGTAVGPTAPAASSSLESPVSSSGSPRPLATPTPATTATVTTTVTAAPGSTQSLPATATTTASAIPTTDLSGEVYGFITAVDLAKSQITLDKADWFTGAAAQQACAEDGVTQTDNNWCTGYYYRNVNPALRVVAVGPGATISTLDGAQSVPSDLSTVASRVGVTGGMSPYRLVVTDGAVTDLREIYRP